MDYKITKKINAAHKTGNYPPHVHTFIITVLFSEIEEERSFYIYEKIIQNYFKQYRGKILNETEKFKENIPTLENMGIIFFKDLKEILKDYKIKIKGLEIGDSPTKTFIIIENSSDVFL